MPLTLPHILFELAYECSRCQHHQTCQVPLQDWAGCYCAVSQTCAGCFFLYLASLSNSSSRHMKDYLGRHYKQTKLKLVGQALDTVF
jgi:hypothetical protein